MDIDLLRKDLIEDEGIRYKPYVDTKGKITIGVGRNLTDVGINSREMEFMLATDIDRAIINAERYSWYGILNEPRQRVIVNMMFNLGIWKFMMFKKMIAALEVFDFNMAAIEMLNSKWAIDVGKRADRLAEMMREGK